MHQAHSVPSYVLLLPCWLWLLDWTSCLLIKTADSLRAEVRPFLCFSSTWLISRCSINIWHMSDGVIMATESSWLPSFVLSAPEPGDFYQDSYSVPFSPEISFLPQSEPSQKLLPRLLWLFSLPQTGLQAAFPPSSEPQLKMGNYLLPPCSSAQSFPWPHQLQNHLE